MAYFSSDIVTVVIFRIQFPVYRVLFREAQPTDHLHLFFRNSINSDRTKRLYLRYPKKCISNDNEGRMIERNFFEIQGAFLVKIRDNTFYGAIGENVFKHINKFLEVVGPIKINGVSQDRSRLSIFSISLVGVADIDGFCNGGELPRMVHVGSMTSFQDHKWYDEIADGRLKEESLMNKAKVEES
nr:hypothetical protein [Tanacetum cinerariifolium]